MIIRNDTEVTVYAKENPITRENEKGTVKFYKNEMPVLEKRDNFAPGDIDKMTVFIWIEGDDPECLNNLLGGEIKMHMEITEEHKDDARTFRQYYDDDDNDIDVNNNNNGTNDDIEVVGGNDETINNADEDGE